MNRNKQLAKSIALPILVVVVVLVIPQVATDYWLFNLSLVAVYAIVALGYNLLIGNSGLVSMAPGAFVAVGAYSVAIAQERGWSTLAGIVLGVVVAAGLSLIIGGVALRLSGFYLALVTLAIAGFLLELVGTLEGQTGGYGGIAASPVTLFESGYGDVVDRFYAVVLIACLMVWLIRSMVKSYLGRTWMLVRDAEIAAATCGVRASSQRLFVFVISGVTASIGGVFYASIVGYLDPTQFGLHLTLMMVTAVLIGGSGSIAGSVLGAAFFVLLPQQLQASQASQALGFGAAIMLVILFLPGGISSLGPLLKRQIAGRRAGNGTGAVPSLSPATNTGNAHE